MEKVYGVLEVEETKVENKKKNKGFSLVELIIVIAIMAILVGVVGTQVLPYMEKARRAKDMQVVSAICTAAVTTFAENAGKITADATYTYADGSNESTATEAANVTKSLQSLLGVSGNVFDAYLGSATADTTATKLESKLGKTATKFTIVYDHDSGEVTVQLYDSSSAKVLEEVKSK